MQVVNLRNYKNNNAFTLIELIVVLAVLAIIAIIAIPLMLNYVETARLSADKATVRSLNGVTHLYRFGIESVDPFENESKSDDELMQMLVDVGYIPSIQQPQSKDAEFSWNFQAQLWLLSIDNIPVPLSPLGSTFDDISSGIISLIIGHFEDTGKYGRTWGDYVFTDIGLNPADWQNPILHIYFKPGGATLRIRPEDGYSFTVTDVYGTTRTLKSSYNWDLIYNDIDKKWYYHTISAENEIDINTLVISN